MSAGRWFTLSLAEQLGNVGSEVGRATKWLNKDQDNLMRRCLDRAFELLDLTISDARWQNHRQKELKIAREILTDTFYGTREYGDTPEKMEKYFYEFALEARSEK